MHDWLVTDAGAEKVLRAILDIYPDADVFSLVDFLSEKERKSVLKERYAKTSFVQKLPFAKKHFRNYFFLFPTAIESFDVSAYDLLISSSWAVAKGLKRGHNQIHISYCYTPIRYAWDLYHEYTDRLKQPKKSFVQLTLKYIRKWDIQTLHRVDHFIADSKFVQQRIERIYKRASTVIYPPVDIKSFTLHEKKEEYYLTASRLVGYKKTQLIVEAFNAMPEKKLIVIGDGEEYENIKKVAKANVLLLGYQEKSIMICYMQKAKAFVYAAIEDFGIVPIEAMACGTPVIALNDGGTAETVVDGFSGILFQKQTTKDIIDAVKRFEKSSFQAAEIARSVCSFSYERFQKEMQLFINKAVERK